VESFITDKYVNKRWIDLDVKAEPAQMFWHHKKHFQKYVARVNGGASNSDDEEEQDEDSEDEEDRKDKKKKEKKEKRKQEKEREKLK
jgi:superoxide dismutase